MGIESIRNKKFLILGATGCLGSQCVSRLEEFDAEVIPVIGPGYPDLPKRTTWKSKSAPVKILSKEDTRNLPPVDYVINFYWKTNRELDFTGQLFYEIKENIKSLDFLWEWISGSTIKKFINISTINIYSRLNSSLIRDETEPKPLSPYGIAKLCGENYFDAYFYKAPFQKLHLRLCSVMSFGEHPSHIITQLYNSAFNKKPINININHSSYLMQADEIIDYTISASLKEVYGRLNLVKDRYPNEGLAERFCLLTQKSLNALYEDQFIGVPDLEFLSSIHQLQEEWIRTDSLENTIMKIVNSYNSLVSD